MGAIDLRQPGPSTERRVWEPRAVAALSPLRANLGKAVNLWALLNNAAPGDAENDFGMTENLGASQSPSRNIRQQAVAI